MISHYIEQHFKPLLLNKITFVVDNKVVKKGKLILLAAKDFHIFFTLQMENNSYKQFVVPIPYAIIDTADGLIMDYSLECLSVNNLDLLVKLKTTTRKKNTRFFDTKMHCKR